MEHDFTARELKPYKGYQIDKCYWVNSLGKKIGLPFYLIAKDYDYVTEEYGKIRSLKEAKELIDDWTK